MKKIKTFILLLPFGFILSCGSPPATESVESIDTLAAAPEIDTIPMDVDSSSMEPAESQQAIIYCCTNHSPGHCGNATQTDELSRKNKCVF